ncbi:hypothetical protein [Alteribacillus bidgolensis]|uniref:Uncharacterized protein n=1 Tax=Alteribacillus bidgolensis TaxID=930129 RepID=A0A1G8ELM9_9BACI|nr:hypothetical protein [Alteribacillus bidgolensis]SDH70824.1 hypothetical protein SAMN05216352_102283 [Alteribacillus bidgolensis]
MIPRNGKWFIVMFLAILAVLIFFDYIDHNSLDLLSNTVHALFLVIVMRLFNWLMGFDSKSEESKTEK